MEAVRIISKKKPVTRNRKEALATMNVAMCAARATQRSSELAAKGMIAEAKLNSRAWRHTMAAHVCSEASSAKDQQQCVLPFLFCAFCTSDSRVSSLSLRALYLR